MAKITLPENCVKFYTSSPIDGGIETKIPISLMQNDNSMPVVAFTILEGNKPYIPPDSAQINICWSKPDKHSVYNPVIGTDENGVVYFSVSQQMTAADGCGFFCLEIITGSGTKYTKNIPVYISKNPLNLENIESTDEYKTIQEIYEEAISLKIVIEGYKNDAQSAATNAKTSETNAKTSETNAKTSETNAKNSATNAKASETNAKSSENQALQYKNQAQTSANNAEDSATLSKSWAVGNTGVRDGENSNNAKYWAEQAAAMTTGYLGYYGTVDAFELEHRSGKLGEYAIIGETDSIWVYDDEEKQFINSEFYQYYNDKVGNAIVFWGKNNTGYVKMGTNVNAGEDVFVFDDSADYGTSAQISPSGFDKRIVFTGEEDWQRMHGFTFRLDLSSEITVDEPTYMFSNKMPTSRNAINGQASKRFNINTMDGHIVAWIAYKYIDTVEEFKQLLSTWNTLGNPLTLYYRTINYSSSGDIPVTGGKKITAYYGDNELSNVLANSDIYGKWLKIINDRNSLNFIGGFGSSIVTLTYTIDSSNWNPTPNNTYERIFLSPGVKNTSRIINFVPVLEVDSAVDENAIYKFGSLIVRALTNTNQVIVVANKIPEESMDVQFTIAL